MSTWSLLPLALALICCICSTVSAISPCDSCRLVFRTMRYDDSFTTEYCEKECQTWNRGNCGFLCEVLHGHLHEKFDYDPCVTIGICRSEIKDTLESTENVEANLPKENDHTKETPTEQGSSEQCTTDCASPTDSTPPPTDPLLLSNTMSFEEKIITQLDKLEADIKNINSKLESLTSQLLLLRPHSPTPTPITWKRKEKIPRIRRAASGVSVVEEYFGWFTLSALIYAAVLFFSWNQVNQPQMEHFVEVCKTVVIFFLTIVWYAFSAKNIVILFFPVLGLLPTLDSYDNLQKSVVPDALVAVFVGGLTVDSLFGILSAVMFLYQLLKAKNTRQPSGSHSTSNFQHNFPELLSGVSLSIQILIELSFIFSLLFSCTTSWLLLTLLIFCIRIPKGIVHAVSLYDNRTSLYEFVADFYRLLLLYMLSYYSKYDPVPTNTTSMDTYDSIVENSALVISFLSALLLTISGIRIISGVLNEG